jgi:hypothetical protein
VLLVHNAYLAVPAKETLPPTMVEVLRLGRRESLCDL